MDVIEEEMWGGVVGGGGGRGERSGGCDRRIEGFGENTKIKWGGGGSGGLGWWGVRVVVNEDLKIL